MRILIINEVCGHTSTGKICVELAAKLESHGHEVKIAYGRDNYVPENYKKYAIRIGNDWDVRCHAVYTRITDKHGLGSVKATRRFLKWVKGYNPDLIWLHNLHGYYINYELLFDWIKKHPRLEVKWTLHDCWAFTGHCTHFTFVNCDKWKMGCHDCPQKKEYPASIVFDNSRDNYRRKKIAFLGIKNLTIITPSKWLKGKVKESFLGSYKVEVHHNTNDKKVFKPIPSDFRKKYGLDGKTIILGVANVWNERKGLNDFLKLATMLDDSYAIVLVGLNRKQMDGLPKWIMGLSVLEDSNPLVRVYTASDTSRADAFDRTHIEGVSCESKSIVFRDISCEKITTQSFGWAVEPGVDNLYKVIVGHDFIRGGKKGVYRLICIPKTANQMELVKVYCGCDLFVNPTLEDTYPTVNLEAQACGIKVITYNVGGAKETIIRDDFYYEDSV